MQNAHALKYKCIDIGNFSKGLFLNDIMHWGGNRGKRRRFLSSKLCLVSNQTCNRASILTTFKSRTYIFWTVLIIEFCCEEILPESDRNNRVVSVKVSNTGVEFHKYGILGDLSQLIFLFQFWAITAFLETLLEVKNKITESLSVLCLTATNKQCHLEWNQTLPIKESQQ